MIFILTGSLSSADNPEEPDFTCILSETFESGSTFSLGGANAAGVVENGRLEIDLGERGVGTEFQNFTAEDISLIDFGVVNGEAIFDFELSFSYRVFQTAELIDNDNLIINLRYLDGSGTELRNPEDMNNVVQSELGRINLFNDGVLEEFSIIGENIQSFMEDGNVDPAAVRGFRLILATRESGSDDPSISNPGVVDLTIDDVNFSVRIDDAGSPVFTRVTAFNETFDAGTQLITENGVAATATGTVANGRFEVDYDTRPEAVNFQNFTIDVAITNLGAESVSELAFMEMELDVEILDNGSLIGGDQLGYRVLFLGDDGEGGFVRLAGQFSAGTRFALDNASNGTFRAAGIDFQQALSDAGIVPDLVTGLKLSFFAREQGDASGMPSSVGVVDFAVDNFKADFLLRDPPAGGPELERVTAIDEQFENDTLLFPVINGQGETTVTGEVVGGRFELDMGFRDDVVNFQNFRVDIPLADLGAGVVEELAFVSASIDIEILDSAGIDPLDQIGFLVVFLTNDGAGGMVRLTEQGNIGGRYRLADMGSGTFLALGVDFSEIITESGVDTYFVDGLGLSFFVREQGRGSGEPSNPGVAELAVDNFELEFFRRDPPPEIRRFNITSFIFNSTDVEATIRWDSVVGMNYQVVRSPDLVTFAPVSTVITAEDTTTEFIDFPPLDATRLFYKILEMNPDS